MAKISIHFRSIWLWIDLTLVYVILLPLGLWTATVYGGSDLSWLGIVFLLSIVAGLIVLWRTKSYRISNLWDLKSLRGLWFKILLFALILGIFLSAVTLIYAPNRWFEIFRTNPKFLMVIWIAYPLFSVLSQEILYRPIFFNRYGELFSSELQIILVNAALFSLVHLMFQNVLAMILTFIGGAIFAFAYSKTNSFPLVFILHWIAGGVTFTVGLGYLFFLGG